MVWLRTHISTAWKRGFVPMDGSQVLLLFRFSQKILLISGVMDKAVVGKDGDKDIKPLFELKDKFLDLIL